MPLARRAPRVTALAATLGVAAVLAVAGPVAAVDDWGTLDRIDDSRVQACKVPVDGDRAWRIKLRITTGEERAKGAVVVQRRGERTDRRWRTGWVAPDSISEVGSVRVPRGNRHWTFLVKLSTDVAGSVSSGAGAPAVGRC